METPKNILRAIAGESMARNKYTFFAAKAREEGFEQIAATFLDTADNEKEHANRLVKLLTGEEVKSTLSGYEFPVVKSTNQNLAAAAAGEHYENTEMYPEFEKVAKKEGFSEAATVFKEIGEVEEGHEKRYLKLKENIEKGLVFSRAEKVYWRCRNCGYLHFGEDAPETCPACAHPRSYYELKPENY